MDCLPVVVPFVFMMDKACTGHRLVYNIHMKNSNALFRDIEFSEFDIDFTMGTIISLSNQSPFDRVLFLQYLHAYLDN